MDIRQLQYLVALAREQHFTRAAAACNVTQPTLSGRIRQLEQELGVPIVRRGQRYEGLTPEGERVLKWARAILEDCDEMLEDLSALKGELTGRAVLGVIPSALSAISEVIGAARRRYPGLALTLLSLSSREIMRGLEDFSIDVGVSYLDNEPIGRAVTRPLYMERYSLYVRDDHALAKKKQVTWADAAAEPLALLTPNMQNRRIIDSAFKEARSHPEPEIETNSIINLASNVQLCGMVTILPEYFVTIFGAGGHLRAIPLVEPDVAHAVGLIALDRDPQPPVVSALFEAAGDFPA